VLWSIFTIAGIFVGVEVYLRRRERVAAAEARGATATGQAAIEREPALSRQR
jgi:hypothetical protein